MDHRTRLAAALAHRTPDQVPVDLGGTPTTGIHCSVVAALREHLGLERRPVTVHEPYQMLGVVEDDLAQALGIDTVGVTAPSTIFGFRNEGWTPWRTPWGQEVLVSKNFQVREDPNGEVYAFPQGDRTADPSAHMPSGGWFFDSIVRQGPIDEDNLDPADNCEEFTPWTQADLDHYVREVDAAWATGRAVVATLGGTALGDIALVPAPFLKKPKGIRDITEWYISTRARQDYIHKVFEHEVDVALKNLERLHAAVGDRISAVFVCGTDFGSQRAPMCAPKNFDSLWKPHYQRLTGWMHQHTAWKTFKHSCGAIEPLVDGLIEAGFDILNPVQCSATGMDPAHLKAKFGDRVVFWGGAIDTQQVLPFGTPAQVREQALERLKIFSPGGGFVFNPIHNVQACTPVENLLALFDAVREFNGQPCINRRAIQAR